MKFRLVSFLQLNFFVLSLICLHLAMESNLHVDMESDDEKIVEISRVSGDVIEMYVKFNPMANPDEVLSRQCLALAGSISCKGWMENIVLIDVMQ